jgi:hypothetical protein
MEEFPSAVSLTPLTCSKQLGSRCCFSPLPLLPPYSPRSPRHLQVNERKRHSESFNEVLRIQRCLQHRNEPAAAVKDIPSISAPERRIMGSCWALLKTDVGTGASVVRFILFNDALLLASPDRKKTGLVCEHIIPLRSCEGYTHAGPDAATKRCGLKAVDLGMGGAWDFGLRADVNCCAACKRWTWRRQLHFMLLTTARHRRLSAPVYNLPTPICPLPIVCWKVQGPFSRPSTFE